MVWRLDGKILVVVFNDGKIKFFDIENVECIYKIEIELIFLFMDWIEEGKEKVLIGDCEMFLKNLFFFVEKLEFYFFLFLYLLKFVGVLFLKEIL